ncbi:hypothetical protein R1sor_024044 [Riccia sorocarpa]|uniref:Uncharacterized protein n=1 Tax=Riccia sorocarpa TaxID=122646 RepID=A0ABD3GPI6_9MARC
MEAVGVLASKDADMEENDSLDLEYDELSLLSNKRRRKGSGNFSFTFTSASSQVESNDMSQCPSVCRCSSADAKADKSKLMTKLRFQCLAMTIPIRNCQSFLRDEGPIGLCSQGFSDKSHVRGQCHVYGPEVPVYGEINPVGGFPGSVDRDTQKKWMVGKNDVYEHRTSKYHQSTRSISFLDSLRSAQSAKSCASSHRLDT